MFGYVKNRTGQASELWPVFALLMVVAVPTIGVLWLVGVVAESQQLAAKQRLTEAYTSHLEIISQQVAEEWQAIEASISTNSANSPGELFAHIVKMNVVDSAVILDSNNHLAYPDFSTVDSIDIERDPRWDSARQLENERLQPRAAVELYAQIASATQSPVEQIYAIQSQLRCLMLVHDTRSARNLMSEISRNPDFDELDSEVARSLITNIELMAVDRIVEAEEKNAFIQRLLKRVKRYDSQALSSSQRLFVIRQLATIAPDSIDQKQLTAEQLAAEFATGIPNSSTNDALTPSHISDVWSLGFKRPQVVALLTTGRVTAIADSVTQKIAIPNDVRVRLVPPTAEPAAHEELVSLPAGAHMPGWRFALYSNDPDSLSTSSAAGSIYAWIGALVVLFVTIFGFFVVRTWRQQLRLTRLKNNLLGTVSHELKTPLSSMRMLVETLLDEEELDPKTTREYLELISKENLRLSRLIENFLAFSRMERNRHAFDLQPTSVEQSIDAAMEAAGDRFKSDCEMHVHVEPDLPELDADQDALVTVLLNLLDNAYKYSDAPRKIALAATKRDDRLEISVRDNGIGMAKYATKRVFDRFYQVDEALDRSGNGCGLGLSIVSYIVNAHGGTITVESQLERGSTFCLTFPLTNSLEV